METRERTKHQIEPSKTGPGTGPITSFDLIRHDFTETRRSGRENWSFAIDQPSDRRVIATFTRPQLVKLIADGADWLAYLGDDG